MPIAGVSCIIFISSIGIKSHTIDHCLTPYHRPDLVFIMALEMLWGIYKSNLVEIKAKSAE